MEKNKLTEAECWKGLVLDSGAHGQVRVKRWFLTPTAEVQELDSGECYIYKKKVIKRWPARSEDTWKRVSQKDPPTPPLTVAYDWASH